MSDETAPRPLTDQAISRLRKLAEGNGFTSEQIVLADSQEKVWVIEGLTHLAPFCDVSNASYPGPVRGKERTMFPSASELHTEAHKRQKEFYEKREWLPASLEELKSAPGEGWGLDGARIALHKQSAILVATEACPGCQGRKMFTCAQCQGQGTVVCTYCLGKGQEFCYNCNGLGTNPAHPGQPCVICLGKKLIPCRFCRSSGHLICPTCQGKRGTVCPQCQGAGNMTQEIGLACGATINFSLKGDTWPSGLRRGLDRLGIVNLAKGHADIVRLPDEPAAKGEEEERPTGKVIAAIIRYHASLPYADLRIRFASNRVSPIAVFGKRGLTMGVPSFLDESLKPAREKLKQAAAGKIAFDKALDARAIRDAFALEIAGQGKPENLRRIYPLGLSPKAMQEILLDMRGALHRHTLIVRTGAAVACGVAASALLAAFMLSPVHMQIMSMVPWVAGMGIDVAVLCLAMVIGWVGLGKAVQFKLKRQFPKLKISLHGNAGNMGTLMLLGISVAWLAVLIVAPARPPWLLYILGLVLR